MLLFILIGGCRGNGKEENIGAYGIVMLYGEHKREVAFAVQNTTNNIMELIAVIEALRLLKEPCNVKIHSDSAYVVNAINNEWLPKWKENGWKTAGKGKTTFVKNQELWIQLDKLLKVHKVEFIKVAGHSDNKWNNRADTLANIAMDQINLNKSSKSIRCAQCQYLPAYEIKNNARLCDECLSTSKDKTIICTRCSFRKNHLGGLCKECIERTKQDVIELGKLWRRDSLE